MEISQKSGTTDAIFETHSAGLKTNRDTWVYNASRSKLAATTRESIDFYNGEVDKRRADTSYKADTKANRFKWCQSTLKSFENLRELAFDDRKLQQAIYRPYQSTWLYKDKDLNWSSYLMPRFFPSAHAENRVILVKQRWHESGQLALMVDRVVDLQSDGGSQCFARYIYEQDGDSPSDLFAANNDQAGRRDAITAVSIKSFRKKYAQDRINADDIFHYVYGMLHSGDYRERFSSNLSKQLPRIPTVNKEDDFWAFVAAGRELGDLHVNYETVEPYPVTIAEGDLRLAQIDDPVQFYRVEQMKFAGKRPNLDKTTVHYNPRITMTDIPLEAYDYVVNGKPALEWVMERQCVKKDKKSGIVNDANDYANETMNNPAYPLELFQRVITVSLETQRIVNNLPALDIE